MNKHVVLALLLCLATVQARLFHDDALASAGRSLLADCPDGCKDGSCMPDSTTGGFRCIQCNDGINLDLATGKCVCPPGRYANAGTCVDCLKGSFCPGDVYPTAAQTSCDNYAASTGSPAGGLTTRGKRAKTSSACVNSPGYSFSLDSNLPKATVCDVNFYGPGLKKQAACVPCPNGFITTLNAKTKATDCVVPKGFYLKGPGEVAPCPKGEFQDTNTNVGKCTPCGVGITTTAEASQDAKECKLVLPTYYPASISGTVGVDFRVDTTKKCPQKYYCPGGEVIAAFTPASANPGADTQVLACDNQLWTESFGAYSPDQCLTPPGHFTSGSTTTMCNITNGEYRADWKRAAEATACNVCGSNILSEVVDSITQYDINDETITTQLAVPASAGACYILPGQGMYYSPTSNTFSAVNCDKDNYGVSNKTNGLGGYACRQCPVNMVASDTLSPAGTKATNGLTSPLACVNIDGFGYNGRIATQCPIDSYNAAGNRLTCTKCLAGRRTSGTASQQVTIADCKIAEGFGSYGGQVVPCPVGTYNNALMTGGDAECTACGDGLTTSQPGGLAAADCNLCKAGWGGAAGSCSSQCGDGVGAAATYGPTGREAVGSDSACLTCPTMTLGFTFNYNGTDNKFTPDPVSRLEASSAADCLSRFAQLAPDAWYMNGAASLTADATATSFESCANNCAAAATCVFITYNYTQAAQADKCKYKAYIASGTGDKLTAIKAVQAGDVSASSIKAVQGKGLASGSYTFWHEDGETWGTAGANIAAANTVQKCLSACDIDALCAGVVMAGTPATGITDATAVTSCKLIAGDTSPAKFIRSATKADRARLTPSDSIRGE